MAALERCSALCLDSEEERERVATDVLGAIAEHPDAVLIRRAFEHAPTGGTKLIVMRGVGGRREAELLNAAARLAQCDEVQP
jgi:phosphoheptose isomerase